MPATTKKTTDARSVSVGSTQDENTLTLRVQGKEMNPKIQPGDFVEIDPVRRIQGGGGTYMVELDGRQLLQIVQVKPGRRLRLASRNDQHEDTEIRQTSEGEWVTPEGHHVEFEVVGRLTDVLGTDPFTS
ncbi:S24 family peptidase [Salinibacter ruber]|uniref:S24 family peptidase n=1 Tax=Salinibacter ruber TaxID=146919 RepID=UPI002073EE52|nr:S24 family peptidase [Salinibacter ruber]